MTDLTAEITAQTGKPLRITSFNWLHIRLLARFWKLARELLEMRYLYDVPHSLAPETPTRLLSDFKPTPLRQVVAEHLHPL